MAPGPWRANGPAMVPLDRSPDGRRYEVAWRIPVDGIDVVIAARLDSSHLSEKLRAYVWRIAGLVAVIVLVVTAGTMLVLHLSLLAQCVHIPLVAAEVSSLHACRGRATRAWNCARISASVNRA